MRTLLLSLLLSLAILPGTIPAEQRPNIVLIYADDLGWKDVGYQGSDFYETPHLDKLAAESVVFSSGYACGANCAPSRACLLSGQYTPRHHLYAVGNTGRGPKKHQRLIPVPNQDGLANTKITIAEALKNAGYATGHFGKWHLAGKDGSLPTEQGFDVTFNSFGDKELPEGTQTNKKGPPEDPKGVFVLTAKACDFIEANRNRPFFCYLAHHAIHTPLQGQPSTQQKFKNKSQGNQHTSAMYASCLYDLDQSVGRILEKLESLGIAENTLLVFTSDNGATPQSPQEPLRGNTGGYYEGGIRVPWIVRWPGKMTPGFECDIPVTQVDLLPTFLEAAGVNRGDIDHSLDGTSLVPLLKESGQIDRSAIFWHFPGYLDRPVIRGRALDVRTGFRTRPISVIRRGDWKLHLFHEEWVLDGGQSKLPENGAVELYNLKSDLGEREDLAAAEPKIRDQLLAELLNWHEKIDAKLPHELNPDYRSPKN